MMLLSIPLVASAFTFNWISLDNQYAASSFSIIDNELYTYLIVDDAYILPPVILSWNPPPPELPFRHFGESAYPTAKRIFLPGDMFPRTAGQCVAWVQYHAGVTYSGNAIEWQEYINSETPEIGAIIVLDIGYYGHIGIVIAVEDGEVTYRSRNKDGLWVVSDNTISIDDPLILGYIII